MRRLIRGVTVFALIWAGWWVFASHSLQASMEQWLSDRRAEGWQAETSGIESSGFPFFLQKTLVAPALADPETGVAFSTSALELRAPVLWPGYVTLSFPPDEIVLASPQGQQAINAEGARAELRLKPGTALELEEMALTSGAWSLTAPEGSLMAAQGLTLRLRQNEDLALAYDLTFEAPAFQPGTIPRSALRIPADWPLAFDTLSLDATVVFDRVIDRAIIEEARPQPTRLDLRVLEAVWGTLLLRASTDLNVSPDGRLTGDLSLQARNWRGLLDLADAAGTVPPALLPQIESVLQALAQGTGNPDTIDVTLSLRDGRAFLGFIPLGPAPRIILR
ncbi:MAG: DUF2125 domain-containing protein [Pseudomonadota bacterium]